MTVLALKLLLAPGFIVATSLLSRRFGVGVAGVVAGLPAIAGPILLVLALDHDHGFVQGAATGVLLGIVALVVFVLAFAWVGLRAGWPWALAAGWGSFVAVIAALSPVDVGPIPALAVACTACAAGSCCCRGRARRRRSRWYTHHSTCSCAPSAQSFRSSPSPRPREYWGPI